MKLSVILVAGGTGTRMKSDLPKQFLMLKDKPVARHSFDIFLETPQVEEIVVVCDPLFESIFKVKDARISIKFALPGTQRQDSVFNGLQKVSPQADLICIHDAARPFLKSHFLQKTIEAAQEHGAATVGTLVKFTVKESDPQGFVNKTLNRSNIWEIQTPQIIKQELLHKGFAHIRAQGISVTDDVSIIETLGLPVKLVEGDYSNIKLTTPEDLSMAHMILGSP